jgi:lactate racemase
MATIHLAYGKTGLLLNLPDSLPVTVVEPHFTKGLDDPHSALTRALQSPHNCPPLKDCCRSTDRVGIIFSDISRPTPDYLMLPAILSELAHLPQEQITLFNACGTHRKNTETELRAKLGDDIFERYRIVQNDAYDPQTLTRLGKTSRGLDIWVNREVADCDIKILTGFIEPHFFAGFSGGGKAFMPGMAGIQTILGNHDAMNIGDPRATWGITKGNPIWEEVREVALKAGRVFLVNVTLNKNKEITGVFAGELDHAHAVGCAFAKSTAMVPVPREFDIVITTNSGFPLDLNLYQAVKGMSAASLIVRPGGTIIIAADCWDGIPDHGLYGQLLRESSSPEELLAKINSPGFLKPDQWQAQIQASIQGKAKIYVYSDHLSNKQINSALLLPCRNIEALVVKLCQNFSTQPMICILPEGPQTIPYIDPDDPA